MERRMTLWIDKGCKGGIKSLEMAMEKGAEITICDPPDGGKDKLGPCFVHIILLLLQAAMP